MGEQKQLFEGEEPTLFSEPFERDMEKIHIFGKDVSFL